MERPARRSDAPERIWHSIRATMNGVVLVLNQDYEPLNVTNLPRAFRLVFGAKAEILEFDHQVIRTVRQEFQIGRASCRERV